MMTAMTRISSRVPAGMMIHIHTVVLSPSHFGYVQNESG
jgi:hypothetical protein